MSLVRLVDAVFSFSAADLAEFPLLAPFAAADNLQLPLTTDEYLCLLSTEGPIAELLQRLEIADRVDHQRIYSTTIGVIVDRLLANPPVVASLLLVADLTIDQQQSLLREVLRRRLVWWPQYQVVTRGMLISSSLDGRALLTDARECYYDGRPTDFFANSPYFPFDKVTGRPVIVSGTNPPQLAVRQGTNIYHPQGIVATGCKRSWISSDGQRYLTSGRVVFDLRGIALHRIGFPELLSPRMQYKAVHSLGAEITHLQSERRVSTPATNLNSCCWSASEDSVTFKGEGDMLIHYCYSRQLRTEILTHLDIVAASDRYLLVDSIWHEPLLISVADPDIKWCIPGNPLIHRATFTFDEDILITANTPNGFQHSLVQILDRRRRSEIGWLQLLKLMSAAPPGFQLLRREIDLLAAD